MTRGHFPKHSESPAVAYSETDRLAYAEKHIKRAADEGWLEVTKGWEIAKTYRVPHAKVREMKARYRNELSFGGDK